MSIYAKINTENIVENIIVCDEDNINTQQGKHVKVTDLTKIAGPGYFYNSENNKFIAPKPFDSWTLNENFDWVSPVGDSPSGMHVWNEESQEWVAVIPQE